MRKRKFPFKKKGVVTCRSDYLVWSAKKIWLEDKVYADREALRRFFKIKYKETAYSNLSSAVSEALERGLIVQSPNKKIAVVGFNFPI